MSYIREAGEPAAPLNLCAEWRGLARRPAFAISLILSMLLPLGGLAADSDKGKSKEKEKPPEPPSLLIPLPLAAVSGLTNKMTLRGQRLKDLKSVRWLGLSNAPEVVILKKEDSKTPDGFTPQKAGDQAVEIQFFLPESTPGSTNAALIAESAAGQSQPLQIFILSASESVDEKEPNDGFKQAQPVSFGKIVRGALGEGGDVDVFKVAAKAGESIRAEVIAARLGSTLDSALTLYGAKGAVLGWNDDAAGRDAILTYKPAADGDLFLALTSVNEKSAKTHAYLLQITKAP